jgi:hypothetical protein
MPKKLLKYPETNGKVQTGKIYDFYKKYGEIDKQLILNTLGIHFGLIPDDIDRQTMTQDDLDYYFYDITIEPLLGNRHTESNNDS